LAAEAEAASGIEAAKKAPAPAPNSFPKAALRSVGAVNALEDVAIAAKRAMEKEVFIFQLYRWIDEIIWGIFVVIVVL